MTPGELLAVFRSELADAVEPYLWSDEDFYRYADDAQRTFCRLTDGISDARTPEVTQLDVEPGTSWLDLHPSILKLRRVTRGDTGRELPVINAEDMPARGWAFDGHQGPLRALVIGEEEHAARVYPTSSETVALNLLVFRMPLVGIAATDDDDDEFEIAEEHHLPLLDWIKHLAYSKHDAETYDKNKALEFGQRFRAYCEAAKLEARRKRHKSRTVAYGGI